MQSKKYDLFFKIIAMRVAPLRQREVSHVGTSFFKFVVKIEAQTKPLRDSIIICIPNSGNSPFLPSQMSELDGPFQNHGFGFGFGFRLRPLV